MTYEPLKVTVLSSAPTTLSQIPKPELKRMRTQPSRLQRSFEAGVVSRPGPGFRVLP